MWTLASLPRILRLLGQLPACSVRGLGALVAVFEVTLPMCAVRVAGGLECTPVRRVVLFCVAYGHRVGFSRRRLCALSLFTIAAVPRGMWPASTSRKERHHCISPHRSVLCLLSVNSCTYASGDALRLPPDTVCASKHASTHTHTQTTPPSPFPSASLLAALPCVFVEGCASTKRVVDSSLVRIMRWR